MRTRAGHQGHVVALCDYCANTTEFIGLHHAEEKVKAQGWTIRRGNVRCRACTEIERFALARAVQRVLPC
jgi:hypothetical protein